jgi:hypothetical protein
VRHKRRCWGIVSERVTLDEEKVQIGRDDLKAFVYLRNLLADLLEHPQKYSVTAEELKELHVSADTINRVLHRVRQIGG